MAAQIKKYRKRKRAYAAPVGGLFVVLAVVGIIAVAIVAMRLTTKVLDNTKEMQMLEDMIRPVVMFNSPAFEQASDIQMDSLLLYSMWATLSGPKRNTYTYSENAELIIPASDLDVACAKLFGVEVLLTHKTFADYETSYNYDSENNVYNVPTIAQLYVYTPKVEKIERKGEFFNLTVAYIAPVNAWTADFSGTKGEPEPEKRMIYVMSKSKDGYTIVKLQDIPAVTQS